MKLRANSSYAVVLCGLLSVPLTVVAQEAQPAEASLGDLTVEARTKVKAFGKQLKQTLKQTLQSEGAISAVTVCNLEAPAIAESVSTEGWKVSRTALKVRNPANRPELWEQEVLKTFETRLANGTDPKTLEYADVVNKEFRYMKAIPTGAVCLACHGSEMNPQLQQHIKSLYPQDQATGFSVGELRGAFSLTKDLK